MNSYPVFKSFLLTACAALVLSSCGLLRSDNRGGTVDDLPLPQPPLSPPAAVIQPPLTDGGFRGNPTGGATGELTGNRAAVLNNLLRQGAIGPYSTGLPYTYENRRYVPRENLNYRESGLASWYGPGLAGQPTSNGEKFNPQAHTAAHKTLPFSSILKVTNPANGKATLVRINDRGPFLPDHIIDLSQRAARDIGLYTGQGTQVVLELLEPETRAVARATGGTIGLDPGSGLSSSPAQGTSGFVPQPVINTGVQPLGPLPRAVAGQTVQPVPLPSSAIRTTPLAPLSGGSAGRLPVAPGTAGATVPEIPTPAALPPATLPLGLQPVQQTASAPASSPAGFYVQAGSYSSRENAEQVRDKLSGVGNIIIFPVMVSGKQMYRVRVGPYASRRQAQSKLGTVIISGGPNAIVVQEG